MKLSPFNANEDFNSTVMKKWLSSIFEFAKKPETTGDIIIDNSDKGLVLKDTSGTYWRVSVSTSGALTATNIGTDLP